MKVLFICYGNVARSQMAETYYNKLTNSHDAISAGVGKEVGLRYLHPTADIIALMLEEHLDISKNSVKPVTKTMVDNVDKVVVLCDLDDCPKYILESKKLVHIPIADPYTVTIEFARSVRDDVKHMVMKLIKSWNAVRLSTSKFLINFIKTPSILRICY